MKNEQRAASRMLKRAQALGLLSRDGTPLVVDQMEELLAAAAGFRNRHAWRASLSNSATQAGAETEKQMRQQLEALEELGVEILEDPGQPGIWVWTAPTDGCEGGFQSKAEALADAWNVASRSACGMQELTQQAWDAQDLASQCAMVRSLAE
jgi:hypothetical protein